jgi:spore coat protein H
MPFSALRRITVLLILGAGCAWMAIVAPNPLLAQAKRPAGWNESTHGSKVAPDYARLFAMNTVHELRITIPPDRFREMQADLKTLGPAGGGLPGLGVPTGRGGPPDFTALMEAGLAACSGKAASTACSAGGTEGTCSSMFGGPLMCVPTALAGLAQGGALNLISRDPMYVPVSVQHDGRTWTKVGMRYKGNSSLMVATVGDNGKIPFRLDFDRYEDESPEIRNQRFYGFQKLTFSSNFSDDSQIREVLASEIFRDRGVPAPRAAFYRVFVDAGNGPEYWGLYSMIEDPADGAMLDAQLGGGSGNLYKPDGPGADWTRFAPEGFSKKTNESRADFSDVQNAVAALHAPATDPQRWRANLEAVFDVDLFLRWLAVNTAIDNWDAYGVMAHNYYLYGDAARGGRLRWIPWDNNMAFGMGPGGFRVGGPPAFARLGGPPPGARGGFPPPAGMPFPMFGGNRDVLHSQVGDRWPLIQRLLADDVYAARYRGFLEHALGGLLASEPLGKRVRELHALIAPSVVGDRGERPTHTTISSREGFERALDAPGGLLAQIQQRREAIRAALAGASAR